MQQKFTPDHLREDPVPYMVAEPTTPKYGHAPINLIQPETLPAKIAMGSNPPGGRETRARLATKLTELAEVSASQALAKLPEASARDAAVVMGISLDHRAKLLGEVSPSLVLSVHAQAQPESIAAFLGALANGQTPGGGIEQLPPQAQGQLNPVPVDPLQREAGVPQVGEVGGDAIDV